MNHSQFANYERRQAAHDLTRKLVELDTPETDADAERMLAQTFDKDSASHMTTLYRINRGAGESVKKSYIDAMNSFFEALQW